VELTSDWFEVTEASGAMVLRGLIPGEYELKMYCLGAGKLSCSSAGADFGKVDAGEKAALPKFRIPDGRSLLTVRLEGKGLRVCGFELSGLHLLPKPPPPKDYTVKPLDHAGTEYYVATDGDDNNPGTKEKPFRTPAQASMVAKMGDTVFFRAGSYTAKAETDLINPANAGLEGRWITYRSYPGERVEVLGVTFTRMQESGTPQQYLRFEGLVLDGKLQRGNGFIAAADPPLDHVEIIDCEILNYTNKGIRLRCKNAKHFLAKDCDIHHIKGPGVDVDGLSDSRFVRVLSHDNDDGQGAEGDGDGFTGAREGNGVEFVECEAWNCSEDGFDSKIANTRFIRCKAWNVKSVPFKLWADGGTMINCVGLNANEDLVRLSGTTPGAKFSIIHCTLVGGAIGIKLRGEKKSSAQVFCANTILADVAMPFSSVHKETIARIESDGNLYQLRSEAPPTHTFFCLRDGALPNEKPERTEILKRYALTAFLNMAKFEKLDRVPLSTKDKWPAVIEGEMLDGEWTKETGNDKHSILVRDLEAVGFVDLGTGNVHLRKGSPALDRATPAPGAPAEDFDGAERPKTQADIGAFEY
jgi:hypothetical protein